MPALIKANIYDPALVAGERKFARSSNNMHLKENWI
jgi:hypothetical protein